jgi:ADP-ribosylation factor GTPase-activating protein 1
MSNGATPEDKRTFEEIFRKDPASLKCFECGYDNAPWAVVTHGIHVCLDCSGQFRSLGVHIAFVRSTTMDGWSDWKPEKLLLMKAGGNTRCQQFFERHKVPKSRLDPSTNGQGVSLKEKFSNKYAMMYRDMLETEAIEGKKFNEATWQPPQWWTQEQENIQNQKNAMAAGSAQNQAMRNNGTNTNPYGGFGSAGSINPQQQNNNKKSGADDFLDFLGGAVSKVAETTSYLAKEATTKTSAFVDEVSKSAASVKTDDLSLVAKKSADTVTEVATSAWGALSSWTTSGISALNAMINNEPTSSNSSGNNKNDQVEEDGLGALTRNVKPSQQDYGHAEHSKAERGKLVASSNNSPVIHQQQQQQQQQNYFDDNNNVASPTTINNNNNRVAAVSSGPKPVAVAAPVKKTFKAPGAAKKTTTDAMDDIFGTPSTSSSANTTTTNNVAATTKTEAPKEWGWDENDS